MFMMSGRGLAGRLLPLNTGGLTPGRSLNYAVS